MFAQMPGPCRSLAQGTHGNCWRNCWRNCWTFALDPLGSLHSLITCGYHVTTCDDSWHLRSVNYCTSKIGRTWYQVGLLVLGRQRSAPVLLGAQQVRWIQMWPLHLDDLGWRFQFNAHIQNRLPWSSHVWVRTWGMLRCCSGESAQSDQISSQDFVVKSWAVWGQAAAQNPAGQGELSTSIVDQIFRDFFHQSATNLAKHNLQVLLFGKARLGAVPTTQDTQGIMQHAFDSC